MAPWRSLDQTAKVAKARSSGRVKKPPLGLMVGAIVKIPSAPPSPNPAPVDPIVREIGDGGCTLNCKGTPKPVVRPDAGRNEMVIRRGAGNGAVGVSLVGCEALIIELILYPSSHREVIRRIPHPEGVCPCALAIVIGVDVLSIGKV